MDRRTKEPSTVREVMAGWPVSGSGDDDEGSGEGWRHSVTGWQTLASSAVESSDLWPYSQLCSSP